MGIGADDGEFNAEQMAQRLCTKPVDIIGPFPTNVVMPETQSDMPGSYAPLARLEIDGLEGNQ